MEVECEIQELVLEDGMMDGVMAECGNCGHQTTSNGTGEASIRRCLALMREECPEGERNFYVEA